MLRVRALALVFACICPPAVAGDCMKATEYEQLQQRYADLSERFDLASLAQQLVDAASEAGDARSQLAACRKNLAAVSRTDCNSLSDQLAEKETKRIAVQERLSTALDMDEYLATLKLRLEQSRCPE
jgi:hypothetical protein